MLALQLHIMNNHYCHMRSRTVISSLAASALHQALLCHLQHIVGCKTAFQRVLSCCHRAMGGAVKFQDALAERLNLMNCSQQQLDSFLKAHPPQYSPGVCIPEGPVHLKVFDGSWACRAFQCCCS